MLQQQTNQNAIKKAIPFKAANITKYLGLNLNKYKMCIKIYKTLLNIIFRELNKWKTIQYSDDLNNLMLRWKYILYFIQFYK